MKIIEALKQIKDLARKADDLVSLTSKHTADMDFESPVYTDQKGQISQWIQAHRDILKEISRLRYVIQKTNVMTKVKITLDGVEVEKCITEWIHRRKDLAAAELKMWSNISDKGLRDAKIQFSNEQKDAKVRRYYDPAQRDRMISALKSEPSLIDAKLEIVNATTDLLE